jgi:hypothetical protein
MEILRVEAAGRYCGPLSPIRGSSPKICYPDATDGPLLGTVLPRVMRRTAVLPCKPRRRKNPSFARIASPKAPCRMKVPAGSSGPGLFDKSIKIPWWDGRPSASPTKAVRSRCQVNFGPGKSRLAACAMLMSFGASQEPAISIAPFELDQVPPANAAYVGFSIVVSHKECHMPRLKIRQRECELSPSVLILPDNRCITGFISAPVLASVILIGVTLHARADDRHLGITEYEISCVSCSIKEQGDEKGRGDGRLVRSLKTLAAGRELHRGDARLADPSAATQAGEWNPIVGNRLT